MLDSVITEGTGLFLSFTPQSGTKNTDVRISLPESPTFPPSRVTFNGKIATFRFLDDGDIIAQVPDQAGTGKIVVSFQFGNSISSLTNFTYVENPVSTTPTITGFSPLSGGLMTNITVNGANLGLINMATIGGQPARVLSVLATSVRLEVTSAASGPIQLSGEGVSVVSAQSFSFQGSGGGTIVIPQISSFSPTSGPINTDVTILGSNFGDSPAVTFGGVAATVSFSSPTQIIAKVPDFAMTGKIGVSTSVGSTFSIPNFTVTTSTPTVVVPVIESFSPSSGPKESDVFITGRNFTGAFRVVFGTGIAIDMSVLSDTVIRAKVPNNATTGQITVVTPNGSARSATNFTVSDVVISPPPAPAPTGQALGIRVSPSSSNITQPNTGNEERPNFVPFNEFSGRLEITQSQFFDLELVAYRLDGKKDVVTISALTIPGQPSLEFNPNPVKTDEFFEARITAPVFAKPKDYLILIRGIGTNFPDKDYGPYTLTVRVLPAIEFDYWKEVMLEGDLEKIVTFQVKKRLDLGQLDINLTNSDPQELSAKLEFDSSGPLSVFGGKLDKYDLRLKLLANAQKTQFTLTPTLGITTLFDPVGDEPIAVKVLKEPKVVLIPSEPFIYAGEKFSYKVSVAPNAIKGTFKVEALRPVGLGNDRSLIGKPLNSVMTFNSNGSSSFEAEFDYVVPREQQEAVIEFPFKVTYTNANGTTVTQNPKDRRTATLPSIFFDELPAAFTFSQGRPATLSIFFVRAASLGQSIIIKRPDDLVPDLSIEPDSVIVPPIQNFAQFTLSATPAAKGKTYTVVFYTEYNFRRFEKKLLITVR